MNGLSGDMWSADWAWSLPLIAVNVVIHVIALGFITEVVDRVLMRLMGHRRFWFIFAAVMGATVSVATVLHGVEAANWAVAYRLLGALPTFKSAMLYSLSAMTSYGNSDTSLLERWRMMGALEALNGMLLFGLSTAFLFAMIQRVRPVGRGGARRRP
jgi:hypothetical protein